MDIQYTPALREYMEKAGKKDIVVEMVEINNSDLDVTELHVHFLNDRMKEQFLTKRRYRAVETELGVVLFPPFPLKIEPVVTLGLKQFLCFRSISCTGIKV